MNEIVVSVVVPVYNTGKMAVRLIKRILDSYKRLEIVVVDDGSTDNSSEFLNNIKDTRVKVFYKENGGPSSARNFGIGKTKGKYILFMDSDDDVKEDYVKKMISAMDDSIAMAVCGVKYCKKGSCAEDVYVEDFSYKDGENNKSLMLRSLLKDGRMYPVFNKIFRAEVIKNNNLRFDESISFGEDTKFVMDYIDVAKGKIKFILEPLYIYSAGTATSTANRLQKEWGNWQKCFINLRNWVGERPTWNQKIILSLIILKWRASWLKAKF